jgi:hypothetical protein
MEKLGINLVAIPIKDINPPVEWTFKPGGEIIIPEEALPYDPHFVPGYLNGSMDYISAALEEQYRDRIKISTYELLIGEDEREHQDYFARHELNRLGERLKEIHYSSDLTIVLGGNHTGGYVLWHLDGTVVRVDAHYDRWKVEGDKVDGSIYVRAALEEGLKERREIQDHVGGFATDSLESKTGDIFDVDFDAFPEDFGIISRARNNYGFGDLDPEQLYVALTRSNPHVLGFFEYYPEDDGQQKGLVIVVESAKRVIDVKLKPARR